jgi:alcohol dehydrogenase, propanol-preferring
VREADQMHGWAVQPGSGASELLRRVARPTPTPGPAQVLVAMEACGVCRTDLHLAEGELPPRRPGTIPGHQVVGTVVANGPGAGRFGLGDRVGVAWLARTCGRCAWCRRGAENLCPESAYTGWDRDGGFAEFVLADEAYAYRLPGDRDPTELAPLLCAGIIGYRALRRAEVPPGGRLGIYGFGSSAHITAQIANIQGAEIYVMTRGERNRQLARELDLTFVGDVTTKPPVQLDSAIVFAPAGELVPVALTALAPGGTLALAGIYMSDIPGLKYQEHLFYERNLRSVTSNTRLDGEELLRLAARMPLRVQVTTHPLQDAEAVLRQLRSGQFSGSAVLTRG